MPSSNKRLQINGHELKCLFYHTCVVFIFTGSGPSCGLCQIKATTSLALILEIWYVAIFMFLGALFCDIVPVLSLLELLMFSCFIANIYFLCKWLGLCMCVFWAPYTSECPENKRIWNIQSLISHLQHVKNANETSVSFWRFALVL